MHHCPLLVSSPHLSHRIRFPSATIDYEKEDNKTVALTVACPVAIAPVIKERIDRQLQSLDLEEVVLQLPPDANTGSFIGKEGGEISPSHAPALSPRSRTPERHGRAWHSPRD